MGIFDFDTNTVCGNDNKLKDECIIAMKVYDSCRQQDCLDSGIIGPARAACNSSYCGITVSQGEIIVPPTNAAGVTVTNLKVERVVIVSKTPSNFKLGFWDIDLKYVFSYRITFRDINGDSLCSVEAHSVFNKMVTLFGSATTESVISTDILSCSGTTIDMNAEPFVWVESKAVVLRAALGFDECCCNNNNGDNADVVNVTIGLFTIIKLYRLVNLVVSSRGFCIPDKCEESFNNPCDFFADQDFPMDVFAPPQKPEFLAGISNNIPAERDECECENRRERENERERCERENERERRERRNNGCGCGCGCRR